MNAVEQVAPRRVLRQWLQEITADAQEVSYVELTDLAQAEFASDPAFAYAAAQEFIGALLPEMLRELMRHRRHEMISVHSGFVAGERVELSAIDRIARVLEGTGSGGYKSLLEHTKHELLALNARDEVQMATTRKWVSFRSDVAKKMNQSQIVGDLQPAFLESTWKRHFETD